MNLNLDTTTVELNDYQPIEKGWYNAQIIEESERDTSKGGKQLVYKFRIFGDKYKGRIVFENFNVVCPGSDKAESIARRQIAQLGKACGLTNIVNSSDLINKCCQISVDTEEYEGNIKNVIKGYDYAAQVQPSQPSAPAKANWWEKK